MGRTRCRSLKSRPPRRSWRCSRSSSPRRSKRKRSASARRTLELLLALLLAPLTTAAIGCGDDGGSPIDAGRPSASDDASTADDFDAGGGIPTCPTASCETDAQCERQALFAEVDAVLRRSCGSARCHGVLPAWDLLDLARDPCDQRADLIDIPAVEYDRMMRIAPGDPERSWLMVKLTAPYDADYRIEFTPAADWQPPTEFPWDEIGFGAHMPPPAYPITDEEIELFRHWIEVGAPGPLGD